MNPTKAEKALKPDWMAWSVRDQGWLMRVWDHGIDKEGQRSMWVLLTDEQVDVLFAGLRKIKDEGGVANGD